MRLFILLSIFASLCTAQSLHDQNPEVYQKTGLGHVREARQAQQQQPNYRPYSQAPAGIKSLLQFQQAREPVVNIPAQPVPPLTPGQGRQGGPQVQTTAQASAYRPKVEFGAAPQQPTYQSPQQQSAGYRPQQPAYAPQQPAYRPQQPAYAPQRAPQQPAYRPLLQQAPAQGQGYNPQYRPQPAAYNNQVAQGGGQQQPQYSKNIPPAIQQLINAQQNQQG